VGTAGCFPGRLLLSAEDGDGTRPRPILIVRNILLTHVENRASMRGQVMIHTSRKIQRAVDWMRTKFASAALQRTYPGYGIDCFVHASSMISLAPGQVGFPLPYHSVPSQPANVLMRTAAPLKMAAIVLSLPDSSAAIFMPAIQPAIACA
jgi:hypothetical protein